MLHFTRKREWEAAGAEYRPSAMDRDGFVHLAFGHQLGRVATEAARAASDLVLLVVDPTGLEPDLRVEGGFPHLYRPVPVASVRMVVDLPPEEDGTFVVPEPARLAELELTSRPTLHRALARVRSALAGFDRPWWLAGGWAADGSQDGPSRPHLDLDVALLRRDMTALGRHLASWDLRLVDRGRLSPWAGGGRYPASENQLWARPEDGFRPQRWQDFAADPGFVEFLAEDLDGDGAWVFRRHRGVRAPLARLGRPGGPMAAEVALLYKAQAAAGDDPAPAAKASFDFDHALARLGAGQRRWLADALGTAHPGHPWLAVLAG